MRVLVTGGCGFIGGNLVPRLLDLGHDVRVVDNASVPSWHRLPSDAEVALADVRDLWALARLAVGMDAVVHLAAAGSVSESVVDPLANFEVNARGTLNALRAALEGGASRFVFASTGGALVGEAPPPVDESCVPRPISPYGASKLAGEGYCSAFAGSYGLSTVALRFANVYGPRSEHKRGAVTSFIARALRDEPLEIFGDGSATRDFLYVDDVCAGVIAALERPEVGGVVHLASERETSIRELAQLVLDAAGSRSRVEHLSTRPGEIERNFALARHAERVLDFRASTTLEDGLRHTVTWFRRCLPVAA